MAVVPDDDAEAFYLPTDDSDRFWATQHTVGPWDPRTQHAGPPSALVTRAIERLESSVDGPSQLTRLTVDILGPVPTGEVRVKATVIRPGRTVELVEGELSAAGRVAMVVRAWRMRTTALELPADLTIPQQPPPPLPETTTGLRDPAWEGGYLSAVEWRFVSGHFMRPGPATVWSRIRVAVVDGEQPTPTQRLMAVADSGNGLSSVLPFDRWWFINTDLTVHLTRLPVGEWVFVDARTVLSADGVGLAETELHDADGRVGHGAQTLMVGLR